MAQDERRQWNRLELAIPVFVRGLDSEGRGFTELAVTLNISACGALVALRKASIGSGPLTLEIPRPPIPELDKLPTGPRRFEATVIRIESRNSRQLLGLQFLQPVSVQPATAN